MKMNLDLATIYPTFQILTNEMEKSFKSPTPIFEGHLICDNQKKLHFNFSDNSIMRKIWLHSNQSSFKLIPYQNTPPPSLSFTSREEPSEEDSCQKTSNTSENINKPNKVKNKVKNITKKEDNKVKFEDYRRQEP